MRVLGLFLAVLLGACATQNGTQLSDKAKASTGSNVKWSASVPSAKSATSLFDLMPNVDMRSVVNLGLKHNPGVQQQLLLLQATIVQKRVSNADRLPTAELSISGYRESDDDDVFSSSLDISWEIDLWQKLANEVAAANWEVTASQADLIAVKNELVAEIMRAYIQVIENNALLAIEKEHFALLNQYESVILDRYRVGTGSLNDLDDARTNSASSKATIAAYTEAVAESKRALALLLGVQQLPDALNQQMLQDQFPEMLAPLTQLPEQDLARRPDLMAAYSNIRAYEYREKVAYKNLLPSLSLTAALSDSSDALTSGLLKNPIWSLLGQVTAPLFQGGNLRAELKSSEIDTLNSWCVYQETLLTAVKEVQDGLGQERSLLAQIDATKEAIIYAERSATNYATSYRQGLVDILDLLSVYETRFSLKSQLVESQFNQLSNRIDLGLALGLGVSS